MATKEQEVTIEHPFIEVQDIKPRAGTADGRHATPKAITLTAEEKAADAKWLEDVRALEEGLPKAAKRGYAAGLGLHTADEEPYTGIVISGMNAAISLDGKHSWGSLRATAQVPYRNHGLILQFEDGQRKGLPLLYESDEQYAQIVELWRTVTSPTRETYATFIPSLRPEVMALVRETPNVLALARDQVKYEPAMKVHGIALGWLRYISQTNALNQNDGRWNRARPSDSGMETILYDGPAFSVAPVLAGKALPGSVWITADGQFICSTWCQREVSQMPDVDLYTGRTLKHTLMSWLLGPGLEHFGDVGKIAERAPRRIKRAPEYNEESLAFFAALGKWWKEQEMGASHHVYTPAKAGYVYMQSRDQFDLLGPQDQYRGFTMKQLKVEGGPPFHVAYPDGRNGVWSADRGSWYHAVGADGKAIRIPKELLAEMDRLFREGKLVKYME